MKIYFDYNKIPALGGTVITLGNFDGFHLGHQKILSITKEIAGHNNLSSLVITFHPHPRQLLGGDLAVLTPLERKIQLLMNAGAENLLVQPFTRTFAATDPGEFLEQVLFSTLNCRHLVVGYDYSFGKGGQGNTDLIQNVCRELGAGCSIIPPVTHGEEIISSTAIRRLLSQGNVEMAAEFLGRPYKISGQVEKGAGRGKNLGFPTANLYPSPSVAQPALGVYMVKTRLKGKDFWGIANIGYHPTFPDDRLALEVYLLDFNGDLYGSDLEVSFLHRLRPEIRFSDISSLVAQLEEDVNRVQTLLRTDDVLKLQRI